MARLIFNNMMGTFEARQETITLSMQFTLQKLDAKTVNDKINNQTYSKIFLSSVTFSEISAVMGEKK